MAINLPRYSKDSPVDLVDGAYGAYLELAVSHTHTISSNEHTHSASTGSSGNHAHNTGQSGYNFVTTNGTFGYGSGGSTAPAPPLKHRQRRQLALILTA